MPSTHIQKETPADFSAIRIVTESAFKGMAYAGGDEQDVIDRLRKKGALTLSLVAISNSKVVGHIAFSPATLEGSSDSWFALGPVSVLPEFQGNGIGSELINVGLLRIKEIGATGCILTGNPNYYRRFGFELSPLNSPIGEPTEFFMVKLFKEYKISGKFAFHNAFYNSDSLL